MLRHTVVIKTAKQCLFCTELIKGNVSSLLVFFVDVFYRNIYCFITCISNMIWYCYLFTAPPSKTASTPVHNPILNLASESGSSIGSSSSKSSKISDGVEGMYESDYKLIVCLSSISIT